MSEEAKLPLAITVGDQTFRIRINPGEQVRYERIAQTASHALQDILDSGMVGGPRAWAMTIFQLSVELDDAREALRTVQRNCERLDSLIQRIDGALQTDSKGG
jgi:hypothetical protein